MNFLVGSSSQLEQEKSALVTEDDMQHLCRLVEEKDGGPAWSQMMDRSLPNMRYRAWRREPEVAFTSLLELNFSTLKFYLFVGNKMVTVLVEVNLWLLVQLFSFWPSLCFLKIYMW